MISQGSTALLLSGAKFLILEIDFLPLVFLSKLLFYLISEISYLFLDSIFCYENVITC